MKVISDGPSLLRLSIFQIHDLVGLPFCRLRLSFPIQTSGPALQGYRCRLLWLDDFISSFGLARRDL